MEHQSLKTKHPSHDLRESGKSLRIALVITAAMMLVEVDGGFLIGSLALLPDAGHMLTDAAALGLSLFAFWLSSRPKTIRRIIVGNCFSCGVVKSRSRGFPADYNPSLGTKTGTPSAKMMSLPARSEYSPFWSNPEKRPSLPALAIR